jgi:hypothetical protein
VICCRNLGSEVGPGRPAQAHVMHCEPRPALSDLAVEILVESPPERGEISGHIVRVSQPASGQAVLLAPSRGSALRGGGVRHEDEYLVGIDEPHHDSRAPNLGERAPNPRRDAFD